MLDQMATSFGLWSMTRPCLLLLMTILATLSPSATAEICSFWDKGCVDPLAQTAIPFKFDPLFLETMNFFYAFDADGRGKGQAPMVKTGFWIGYQASTNNSVININRTSEIAVRVGNLTGAPSGGNNGCDGVWGSSCSTDLKTYLKENLLEYVQNADTYTNPLSNVIHSFRSTPPILPNCPPTLFEVQNIPVISFVSEDEDTKQAYVKTHGSPDSPWESWFIDDMSSSDQAEQVAVGIIGRVPAETAPKPEEESEIQIELVCARAPSQGSSSSDG